MDMRQEYKSVGLGILFVTILLLIISYFRLGVWGIISLLLFVQIMFAGYNYSQKGIIEWRKIILSAAYIVIIVHFLRWIHQFGAIGYILAIILIVGVILARRWKKFIEVKHHIESMIWGKPLKDYVESGEQIPKIKIKA